MVSLAVFTFQVPANVRGNKPAARVDTSHTGTSGSSTNDANRWGFVAIMQQDLTIEVYREELWLRAHSQQVPADFGVGTDVQIWRTTRRSFTPQ